MANKALIIDNADMSLEQKVMALIGCIAQEKKAQTDKVLSGVGLSLLQLNLLHQLAYASSSGLTVNQLKGAMFAMLKVSVFRFDSQSVRAFTTLVERTMDLSITITGDSAFIATDTGECEVAWEPLQVV